MKSHTDDKNSTSKTRNINNIHILFIFETILLSPPQDNKINLRHKWSMWEIGCQKHIWRAGTSNYIPQCLCDVITGSRHPYLLLADKFTYDTMSYCVVSCRRPPVWSLRGTVNDHHSEWSQFVYLTRGLICFCIFSIHTPIFTRYNVIQSDVDLMCLPPVELGHGWLSISHREQRDELIIHTLKSILAHLISVSKNGLWFEMGVGDSAQMIQRFVAICGRT